MVSLYLYPLGKRRFKSRSPSWLHRESIVTSQNKVDIHIINTLYRRGWAGIACEGHHQSLELHSKYLCRRYLLNQNFMQCVWPTQVMPNWKELVAICFQNPVTSLQRARFCCQDVSCELCGMSFVDTCVITAGSVPTKGKRDVVREGAGWRFSHERDFSWKMSASPSPDFLWECIHHMQKTKWYSWSQWEKGETN